jgi:Uma2 family endonuclease
MDTTLAVEPEESKDMGSFNHSYLQFNIARLLFEMGQYTVLTELSIEMNGLEFRPDISVYSRRKMNPAHDIVKMTELPLLIIEVLSPTQGVQEILDRFQVYFAAGVQSCWLVYPAAVTVVVYAALEDFTAFSSGDVIDETLGIRLPLQQMFT